MMHKHSWSSMPLRWQGKRCNAYCWQVAFPNFADVKSFCWFGRDLCILEILIENGSKHLEDLNFVID